MPLAPGTQLGAYTVQSFLSAGGMGEVYAARDTTLGRDVALKLLPDTVAADPDRLARFEREARLLASLTHPNIGAIFGVVHEGASRALVLEFVDGVTLDDMLSRGPLPNAKALDIARQIADALDAAHENSVVHRDLKPANIKITSAGVVKVLDFGIAKALSATEVGEEATRSLSTHDGAVLGTPRYMSPEQARGLPTDRRTDIWAFGCVLFEMLAGRRAFDGRTGSDAIVSILEREPDWSALPHSTPHAIVRLIERCLEKEPRRRLRDIADARADIEDALRGTGARGVVPHTRVPALRWRYVVWIAAIAAAFAIGAAWRSWMATPQLAREVRRLALPLGDFRLPGETTPFALSRDGRRVVVATGAGGLYIRDLAEIEMRSIAGTAGAGAPFFSPDGEWVGFFADGRLKRVAISGGTPIEICELTGALRGLSWSPDGTIFIGMTNTTLLRVPADGGVPQPFSTLDATRDETSHRWPHVLPGGRAVIFAAGPSVTATQWNAAQIVVQSVATGERRVIVQRGSSPVLAAGYLFYQSGGTLLAQAFDVERLAVDGPVITVASDVRRGGNGAAWFAASDHVLVTARAPEPKPGTLAWLDHTGVFTPLPLPPAFYFAPRLSPDGTRVTVTVSNPDSDVWVYDVKSGNATRITSDGKSLWPIWSPEGTHVAFSSTRRAVSAIRSKRADGTGEEETLVQTPFINIAQCWSRGGVLGYVQVEPNTGSDAWIRQPNGDVTAIARTRVSEDSSCPSPDGRWLALQSNQSGRPEVYVQPMPPAEGPRVQLSIGGGGVHAWSTDGRELYFTRGTEVWAVRAPDGATSTFGDRRRIAAAEFNLGGSPPMYDIAADGRLLVVRRDAAEPVIDHLVVTLNWLAALTTRAPEEGRSR